MSGGMKKYKAELVRRRPDMLNLDLHEIIVSVPFDANETEIKWLIKSKLTLDFFDIKSLTEWEG